MNIIIWLLAGALLGWIGFKFLNANKGRGMVVSMVIGMGCAFFGGSIVAPMFGEISSNPGAFSPFSLFLALVCATAGLTISNMLSRRYGV